MFRNFVTINTVFANPLVQTPTDDKVPNMSVQALVTHGEEIAYPAAGGITMIFYREAIYRTGQKRWVN